MSDYTSIVAVVVSVLAFIFSLWKGTKDNSREDAKAAEEHEEEVKRRAQADAQINFKLDESIRVSKDTNDKVDKVQRQIAEQNDRLIRVEESVKSAWKRIDKLETKFENGQGE